VKSEFGPHATTIDGNDAGSVVLFKNGEGPGSVLQGFLITKGSGIRPAPDPTVYGDFWLMPPWEHRIHFHPIPDNGVRLITRTVAAALPPGTTIPVQALMGTELSNLCLIMTE